MKSSLSRGIAIAGLAFGIGMVGFAGISVAVSDDGGSTGRSAQTPLGERSAPSALGNQGGGGEVKSLVQSGDQGAAPDSAASPGTESGNSLAASHGSSLPFTGLLAIPLLVAGAALLGGGLLLRRREVVPARP